MGRGELYVNRPRILIVEDEAIVAEDLEMAITDIGYEVVGRASRADDAVNMALELKPDLILMDIVLRGEKNGIEASREIKEKTTIPVLFLTAYSNLELIDAAKSTEPYAYIVKPFRERQLLASIEMALYKSKMEARLRESEEWLATTLRSIGDAVIATDRDGYVTFVNPVAEKLTAWTQEDAIGKPLEDIFDIRNAGTGDPVESPVSKVLRDGIIVGLANHTILVARDGTRLPIDDSGAPIRDEDGGIIGVVLVFRDITDRRQMEDALRASEGRHRALFETAEDAIFLSDETGRFVDVNQAACESLGYAREELLELSIADIDAESTGYEEFLKFRNGAAHEAMFEVNQRRRDGALLPVEVTGSFFESGGRKLSLAIARDITERRHADSERERLLKELEAKNAEMERFTYTVSHDLRSPLTTITGFSEMLRKHIVDNNTEMMKSDLEYIERAAAKMDHLLTDTLELSRIGRVVNPPEDVPFGEIVEEVLDDESVSIKSKNLEVSVADDFPVVHVDWMRIEEVLTNLIENSMNYMGDEEHPRIEIGNRCDDGETVFFVTDNGIGIDESQHEKVFRLFHKVDTRSKGTGAGLAIVERIIEVHGGRVWVESEKGSGCTICFTLPSPQEPGQGA